jgi:hypothetical protein
MIDLSKPVYSQRGEILNRDCIGGLLRLGDYIRWCNSTDGYPDNIIKWDLDGNPIPPNNWGPISNTPPLRNIPELLKESDPGFYKELLSEPADQRQEVIGDEFLTSPQADLRIAKNRITALEDMVREMHTELKHLMALAGWNKLTKDIMDDLLTRAKNLVP